MWYMYNRLCAISVHFALNKNHLFVRFVNMSYSFQPLNKYYKERLQHAQVAVVLLFLSTTTCNLEQLPSPSYLVHTDVTHMTEAKWLI